MISAIQTLPNIWHSYHLTVPSLPLKPDPEKGNRWKLASVLTSRMGLFSFIPYPIFWTWGKEEYKKCMGETRFDEVVITSTDSIKNGCYASGCCAKSVLYFLTPLTQSATVPQDLTGTRLHFFAEC